MSKKRSLSAISCESNLNEPPLKRQKSVSNQHHKPSTFFSHKSDNEQYQQIFNAIDSSPMIKSLHITHSISRNIAQFANGQFKKCANDKCNNDIAILHQDSIIYDNNHENCIKVGYKWCLSDKLFCSDCMDLATVCNCSMCDEHKREFLIFALNKCDSCLTPMSYAYCDNPDTDIDCEYNEWICNKCGGKYCDDCNVELIRNCLSCSKLFCDKCYIMPSGWTDDGDCVCHNCYDWNETVIECENCNVKYELLFKGNKNLWNTNLDCKMRQCYDKNCDVFICSNCDTKGENGKRFSCKEFGCQKTNWSARFNFPCSYSAFFCDKHPPTQPFCKWQRINQNKINIL